MKRKRVSLKKYVRLSEAYDALDEFCQGLIDQNTHLKDAMNIVVSETVAREHTYQTTIKSLREQVDNMREATYGRPN